MMVKAQVRTRRAVGAVRCPCISETEHEAGVEMVYAELAGIEHIDWTWVNARPWTLAFLKWEFRRVS